MCSLLKGPTHLTIEVLRLFSHIYGTPHPLENIFFGPNFSYLENDKINAEKVLSNIFYIIKKSPMQNLETFESTAHLY